MFKKLIYACFGLVMCFALTGCGEGEVTKPETVKEIPAEKPGESTASFGEQE